MRGRRTETTIHEVHCEKHVYQINGTQQEGNHAHFVESSNIEPKGLFLFVTKRTEPLQTQTP